MVDAFLNKIFLNNTIFDYLLCIVIFSAGIGLIRFIKRIIINKLKELAVRTHAAIDDFLLNVVEKNLVPLLYYAAFYLSVQHLKLLGIINKMIDIIGVAMFTIISIRFLIILLNYIITTFWLKQEIGKNRERSIRGILAVIKIFIWCIGTIFLLDNLGFKVSTIIAGLGIGGVAMALAAQTILGDLFSFFAIMFDQPFEIGDFIVVGEDEGVVENIGIKTTRIRRLSGEQLVLSNTAMTSSRVRNYKRMERRRVVFQLGLTYQTSNEKLRQIPQIIKNIVDKVQDAVFERAVFIKFADSSLDMEVIYYVIGSDYNKYLDVQQDINLAIKEEFEKNKIDFAYPTQTLYVNKA